MAVCKRRIDDGSALGVTSGLSGVAKQPQCQWKGGWQAVLAESHSAKVLRAMIARKADRLLKQSSGTIHNTQS